MATTFYDALRHRWNKGAYVCIGLDIDTNKFPETLKNIRSVEERIFIFTKNIIDATAEYACAFKLNSAHFEAMGSDGYNELGRAIAYCKHTYPKIPVIVDAKRGDIGDTNEYYARAVFDELGADAVTVHPYMGRISLEPFLSRRSKGVIVMGANSAIGADEFQSLDIHGETLAEYICRTVATSWNTNKNCAVTASALDTKCLAAVRSKVGDMPILLLGVGAQGGDVADCVKAGKAQNELGLIINSSRSILYASSGDDYVHAAVRSAHNLNKSIASALG